MNFVEMLAVNGESVMVDEDDYKSWAKDYILKIDRYGYVHGKHKIRGGGRGAGSLHRLIMNPPSGKFNHVDHINKNKLDNRKENLRICTHSENMRNRKRITEGISAYKGVYLFKRTGKWKAQIKSHKKWIHIGEFTNEIAAANAYNCWALKEHGEFASLNDAPFMEESDWMRYRCGKNKTSKYHGVSHDANNNKWIAQTWDSKSKKNIVFRLDTELEAALKYNELAIIYRGDKAKLNKIYELKREDQV